jgi:hypothetical protein
MKDQQRKMPFRKTKVGKYIKKIRNRAMRYQKKFYQKTNSFNKVDRRHVFIFGCQRSGTTLLGRVFERDLRTAVLQEISCITKESGDILRLKSFAEVIENLNKLNAQLIVAKPLVESHRSNEILSKIPQSKGIWMFRNYRDVIASNINRFSSQIEGLRMTISGDPPSWRSERVSESTLEIIKKFYRPDMEKADAAALGWYSLNNMFFEYKFDSNPDMILFNYDEFVKSPEREMKHLYNFIDVPYPKWNITHEVDTKSVWLGKDIKINSEINELCENVYYRILKNYKTV